MTWVLECDAFTIEGPSITAVVTEWQRRRYTVPDYAGATIKAIRERTAAPPEIAAPTSRPPEREEVIMNGDRLVERVDVAIKQVAELVAQLNFAERAFLQQNSIPWLQLTQTIRKFYSEGSEVGRLRDALTKCLHVVEKGIEVRMDDRWPALRPLLQPAVTQAREALGMPPRTVREDY